MKTPVWQFALGWLLGSVPLAAQTAAPPAGRPTDQPPSELVAKLKTGPPLPYKVEAGWRLAGTAVNRR